MTGAETDIEVERKSGVVVRLFPRNIIRTLPESAIYTGLVGAPRVPVILTAACVRVILTGQSH